MLRSRRERQVRDHRASALAVQPLLQAAQVLVVADSLAEHRPLVGDPLAGPSDIFGADAVAEPDSQGLAGNGRQAVPAGPSLTQQMRGADLVRQPLRPVGSLTRGRGDRRHPPHLPGQAARLGVDHPPGVLVPPGPRLGLSCAEAATGEVGEPAPHLLDAGVDLLVPGGRAALGRLRIDGAIRALAAGRPGRPRRASGQPLGDPTGRDPGRYRAVRVEQEQPERVLARELPARA